MIPSQRYIELFIVTIFYPSDEISENAYDSGKCIEADFRQMIQKIEKSTL